MTMSLTQEILNRYSTSDAKVTLFRSLFRGRDDVYARRFQSRRTGIIGYAPACSHEWVAHLCDKPRIKCADCVNRRFLPVTDREIRWHLTGQDELGRDFVMGAYPLLLDETCCFLAVDFDKQQWREDAAAYLQTCSALGLAAAVERSQSGRGAHVWLFFEEPIPASLARRLGAHMLTETMERRPDIGLDSYDRLFPNQDSIPQGGFGNLIALPLQKRARARGNTEFLTDQFVPHSDQWEYLSRVKRINMIEVEEIVRAAEGRGRVVGVRFVPPNDEDILPWTAPTSRRRSESPMCGPLPQSLDLVLSDEIYIRKDVLSPGLHNRLLRLAAFQNPEFYRAQAMRLPTYDKPRIIACAADYSHHIGLPRGCLEDLQALAADLKITPVIDDKRSSGCPLQLTFRGKLHPEQQMAADAIVQHDMGVLSATTAFGKTVIAAWLIAQRGVSTLVVVHRRHLLEQWVERLAVFLGVPQGEIGRIGGGRKHATGRLDVALIQSLVRKGTVDDRVEDYGHVIVDECHHLPARSFEQMARRAKAKYVTGLSATVVRKDGHHPIVFMQCGPVRYHVDAKEQAAAQPFDHFVNVRPTSFHASQPPDADLRRQYQQLCDQLVADDARNNAICQDILRALRQGRSPIVLTQRHEHMDKLASLLSAEVDQLIVLRGGMRKQQLYDALSQLASVAKCERRVVLSTGHYLGEGFDDPRADTLFLTMPVSWRGTVAQYVGRLHRLHDGKRDVHVYDYADLNVPMFAKMFDRRCRAYRALGYQIPLPASATPGWPAEVALPSDEQWKSSYAAAVRRLAKDGVDDALAKCFVHAFAAPHPEMEGIARARSASEAFLYQRLESHPEIMGLFRLNSTLPIPFDGSGQMEVDLFCPEARVAVEVDGGQHLADADAYRRDRRKDALLQENGYRVLRFLAEDVGKDLDLVLDTILRAVWGHR